MSNKEILEKSIKKAWLNGYMNDDCESVGVAISYLTGYDSHPYATIFSHDFAKAFWGEQITYDEDGTPRDSKGEYMHLSYDVEFLWQYHLQEMVLEENPLKYLEKFL